MLMLRRNIYGITFAFATWKGAQSGSSAFGFVNPGLQKQQGNVERAP
jgi:hypothetical protein